MHVPDTKVPTPLNLEPLSAILLAYLNAKLTGDSVSLYIYIYIYFSELLLAEKKNGKKIDRGIQYTG